MMVRISVTYFMYISLITRTLTLTGDDGLKYINGIDTTIRVPGDV